MVHGTYRHLIYLLTPWLYSSLTALAFLITSAHSSLWTAFCHHLYIFQLSRSRSSSFCTSLRFTLKYFLNCLSLIHSSYMSDPFESLLFNIHYYLMFIGPCIIVIVEEWKTNLMSLAILFHFLCAQHVSDINILRLCWWITTSVVLFSVRCGLEIWCGWFSVVFVLQAEAQH